MGSLSDRLSGLGKLLTFFFSSIESSDDRASPSPGPCCMSLAGYLEARRGVLYRTSSAFNRVNGSQKGLSQS